MQEYITTFYAHFGAMRFFRELKQQGINGKLMPVPRRLSSSCGICVHYLAADWQRPVDIDEVEQVVEVCGNEFRTLYRAENS